MSIKIEPRWMVVYSNGPCTSPCKEMDVCLANSGWCGHFPPQNKLGIKVEQSGTALSHQTRKIRSYLMTSTMSINTGY